MTKKVLRLSPPFEHLLDFAKGNPLQNRPAVGAVTGEIDCVHADEEGLYLRRCQRMRPAHDAMAGDPRQDISHCVGKGAAPA